MRPLEEFEAVLGLSRFGLGDGCLSLMKRQVYAIAFSNVGCVEVMSYWKHWPCLFPQHGPGAKFKRDVSLQSWQQDIAVSRRADVARLDEVVDPKT